MLNFVAIDFETATRSRNSACSIGVAVVNGGRIIDTFSSLLQPPGLAFDDDLMGIHGITADAVRNAPAFTDIWPEVERRCDCGIVVAHNAAFDVGVVCACEADSAHRWLPDRYLCTVRVAQEVLPGLPNHKLRTLANLFGLHLDHHDAASDACACAEIAVRLFRLAGEELVRELCRDIADFGHSSEWEPHFNDTAIRLSLNRHDRAETAGERETLVEHAEADGRFEGQRFVFTGELAYLDRAEAEAIVEQQGGRSTGSVSKKPDIVVVGDEVLDTFKRSGTTTGKLAKAVALQDQGVPISIRGESEFLNMIGNGNTNGESS